MALPVFRITKAGSIGKIAPEEIRKKSGVEEKAETIAKSALKEEHKRPREELADSAPVEKKIHTVLTAVDLRCPQVELEEKEVVKSQLIEFLEDDVVYVKRSVIPKDGGRSSADGYTGEGKIIFEEFWYQGAIKDDQFHGYGILTARRTGERMEGKFEDNKFDSGIMVHRSKDGAVITQIVRNGEIKTFNQGSTESL